jgi:hypothetical protein
MLAAIRSANLILVYLLDNCLLGALAYWGFQVGENTAMKFVLGLGTPLLLFAIWMLALSSQSPVNLRPSVQRLLQAALYAVGVAALFVAGQPGWGMALGVVFVLNRVLLYFLPE